MVTPMFCNFVIYCNYMSLVIRRTHPYAPAHWRTQVCLQHGMRCVKTVVPSDSNLLSCDRKNQTLNNFLHASKMHVCRFCTTTNIYTCLFNVRSLEIVSLTRLCPGSPPELLFDDSPPPRNELRILPDYALVVNQHYCLMTIPQELTKDLTKLCPGSPSALLFDHNPPGIN